MSAFSDIIEGTNAIGCRSVLSGCCAHLYYRVRALIELGASGGPPSTAMEDADNNPMEDADNNPLEDADQP